MGVMKLLRRNPVLPPDRRSRKADVGDMVVFIADEENLSEYPPHVGHEGWVVQVELRAQRQRRSPRAIYEVECECGVLLHPRSNAFKVKDT